MKTNYSKNFRDLINQSNEKSLIFYNGKIPTYDDIKVHQNRSILANPYFVGFGNPAASVLILGKEKGFKIEDTIPFFIESISNIVEWQHLINQNITDIHHKSHSNLVADYTNALYPYHGKIKSAGHTWRKYQTLINTFFSENIDSKDNSFLKKAFISEINHMPSKYSKGYIFHSERLNHLQHKFFQSFPVIILACGNYLNRKNIEDIFSVQYQKDLSTKGAKLVVYRNDDKILIHTRQLSMNITPQLFDDIYSEISSYLPK